MATDLNGAFLNGLAGSSSPQLDDVWKESLGHPGVGTIPAALAVGESRHKSGQELIVAIVAGYEVVMRVGSAVGWTGLDRGWHPRGGMNVFAAAAAATRLMSPLDEDVAVSALGHAGNAASGLTGAVHFHDAWYVLSANASWNGVMAAILAREGLSAGEDVLDAPYGGYVPTVSVEPNLSALTDGIGRDYRILQIGQKLFPSSAATHAAIEAAIDIHRSPRFDVGAVSRIVVRGFHTMAGRLGTRHPKTLTHAGMSVPFLVAAALAHGGVGLDDIEAYAEPSELTRRLQDITSVEVDAALDDAYPRLLGAEVEVALTTGEVIRRRVLSAIGDPLRPLTREQVEDKFRMLASQVITEPSSRRVLTMISRLHEVRDVSQVLRPLRTGLQGTLTPPNC